FAMRLSYVGELGWEFHLPPDVALAVRDELWTAGREFGLIAAGVGAMRSMRLEKGYRLWGADITTEDNPFEAGMGWMVKLNKGEFVGREALCQLSEQPPTRRLVTLTVDDPNAVVTGNEPIFENGRCIGRVTSGNFGYSVGKIIALGYLPPEFAQPGTRLEIEYLGDRYPAVVAQDVLFDPSNARMKV
ncbi:MAG: aminomethyltransferase family protein, partial [Anaerolineae bacterium]|nr:aminomethyltransferase family protein [Anaerolineae bacterium]